MKKPTQLFVVRHGETQWNIEKRLQGHQDSPLTPKGVAQTEALARSLYQHEFSAVYASDLKRTRLTAEKLVALKGYDIHFVSCLRERNLGIFQGYTRQEIAEHFPEKAQYFLKNEVDYPIPEGESLSAFTERCLHCLENIAAKHENERILIITHGGVLTCLFKTVVGIPLQTPRHFTIFNTSLNVFSCQEGQWMLESWGDVSHAKDEEVFAEPDSGHLNEM